MCDAVPRGQEEVGLRQCKEGNVIVWSGFSSTSPDMKDTKAFLSKKKKDPENNEEKKKAMCGRAAGNALK